jgi:hypothetical protein
MGTTASGLRYPEPTDPVNQGATNMKNLATDVDPRAAGLLARNKPASLPDVTGSGTLMATAVTIPGTGQRWIRVTASIMVTQITSAGTSLNISIYGNNVVGSRIAAVPLAVNAQNIYFGVGDFLASPGTFTADLRISSAGGAQRPSTNADATFLTIQDVGKQF